LLQEDGCIISHVLDLYKLASSSYGVHTEVVDMFQSLLKWPKSFPLKLFPAKLCKNSGEPSFLPNTWREFQFIKHIWYWNKCRKVNSCSERTYSYFPKLVLCLFRHTPSWP